MLWKWRFVTAPSQFSLCMGLSTDHWYHEYSLVFRRCLLRSQGLLSQWSRLWRLRCDRWGSDNDCKHCSWVSGNRVIVYKSSRSCSGWIGVFLYTLSVDTTDVMRMRCDIYIYWDWGISTLAVVRSQNDVWFRKMCRHTYKKTDLMTLEPDTIEDPHQPLCCRIFMSRATAIDINPPKSYYSWPCHQYKIHWRQSIVYTTTSSYITTFTLSHFYTWCTWWTPLVGEFYPCILAGSIDDRAHWSDPYRVSRHKWIKETKHQSSRHRCIRRAKNTKTRTKGQVARGHR